jgi:hypothetical protein
MLETHTPGGTDVIVAVSVFLLGGSALVWTLVRRDQPAARSHDGSAESRSATRIPPKVADRLPELLDATAGDIDPAAATTEAGRTAAHALLEADQAYAILAERVRARLPQGTTPGTAAEAAAGSRPPSRQQVEAAVPPVEAAALVVLEEQLRARVRAWESHLRTGSDPTDSPLPRFCSLNPFHGQATVTAEGTAASASDAPVCTACREALADGRDPDVLRVRTRSGVRSVADAEPAYARGFAGAGEELARVVQEPPASGPVGQRGGGRDATGSVLGAIAVPVAGLVLGVVVGVLVSILVAGDGAYGAAAGEGAGPLFLGYPLLNALRGAGIGALAAVLVFGIVAAAINGVRRLRSGRHSPGEGFDPNRRDELDTPVVRENVRRLGER